jgi:hypothetical protein
VIWNVSSVCGVDFRTSCSLSALELVGPKKVAYRAGKLGRDERKTGQKKKVEKEVQLFRTKETITFQGDPRNRRLPSDLMVVSWHSFLSAL